jgi:hypothetical protein
MNIDFEAVAKALTEVNYQGEPTLEADAYLTAFDKENVFEGIKNLAESVNRIREMMK